MTLPSLIKRLEEATEGSRELDALIAIFFGIFGQGNQSDVDDLLTPTMRCKYDEDKCRDESHQIPDGIVGDMVGLKHYTRSIDAALTLVPEGWLVERIMQFAEGWISSLYHKQADRPSVEGESKTLALALCIAALRSYPSGDSREAHLKSLAGEAKS